MKQLNKIEYANLFVNYAIFIDGNALQNEKDADRFVPNGFYGTNSVVKV